jgi:hypothetical protein
LWGSLNLWNGRRTSIFGIRGLSGYDRLGYLAGHRDMNITKRYAHPQEQTIRSALDRAQAEGDRHSFGSVVSRRADLLGKDQKIKSLFQLLDGYR